MSATDRFGETVRVADPDSLTGMVHEIADRARRISPRLNEYDITEARGVSRVLLTRWTRGVPCSGLPDPAATLARAAAFLSDMLDGGDADRVGDEEGGDIDEAEETLVRLIAEHPEDDWLGHLESVLPAALAAARIVDAPPSFRLVESMHGLRGVTPISGAGVVLTTDTWLTGTECREIFPQASRIIEKAIRDRDASPEPESSTARSYLPPLGHIDARTAIDTAVRVRHAMERRAA